ncbi:MAG TPA: choice-of-anchor D domain-containing protein [Acidobacteriaceae bacterium]|nr:choice-of-anchor D domain-containing protein [Acidobacteriaceae bacterium]
MPIKIARASRSGFQPVLFLQLVVGITVSLAMVGCGVTIPGGSLKPSATGALSLSSSSLSFGSVTVGNSAAETVVLTNTGSGSLQVSQIQVSGASFSVVGSANAPLNLAAGSSSTLTVAFTPKAAGNVTGSLSVVADNATDSIALSGVGAVGAIPGLTLSSTSLAFGTVTTNTSVTQSVQLTSSGTAPLTISGATVSGAGFTMSNVGFPLTLSPGQTATLALTFDPTNSGQFTGAVTLNTNTSDAVATIALSGSGQPIQSLLNDLTCPNDNLVGDGTEACSVRLTGPAAAGGLTIGLASSSTAVRVPGSVTVSEGTSSGLFTLSYTAVPTAQTVTLTASTTNSHKQHNLNLGSSTPGLSLSPTALNFGNVTVNSKSSQAVTVTSSGTSSLTINAASVSGAGYAVSGIALPMTLKPGQSANLMVSFAPSTTGSYSGNVTLATNTTTGTAAVTLSGSAQASGALAGLNCASGSMSGTGSDLCTVSLTAAAPSGGLTVALSSNSAAVAVPASVLVPAGATSAGFAATVASVTTSQTATLTAQAGGVMATYAITLDPAATAVLSGMSCANGSMTGAGNDACAVSVSSAAPSGGVAVALSSNSTAVAVPNSVLVPAGATSVGFTAAVSSVSTAQTATITAQAGGSTQSFAISLGQSGPTLNAMICASSSMTAAGNDACTVSLTGAAPSGGLTVGLSSSSSAVAVPGSVTVPAGASSVGFTAVVSTVTSSQTATLTAQAGGVAKSFAISLGTGTPGLTLATTSISFGTVSLNSPSTQTVLLTSSGTSPVTISAGGVSGGGFSISGLTFPVTLNPGATATLNVQFDPTVSGSVTGQVVLTANTAGGGATIALSGTGQSNSYQVDLVWTAPSSSTDPVVGYNVYRAASGSSSYQRLNSTVETATTYADNNVANSTSYTYYVTSVDASGNESSPSPAYSAAIP